MFKSLVRKWRRKTAVFKIQAPEREGHWEGKYYCYKIVYISTGWKKILELLAEMDLDLLEYEFLCEDTEAIITVSGSKKDLIAFVAEFARRANGILTLTQL